MNWIYFAVRIGYTLYLLCRLWDALFRQRLFGIWNHLFDMRQTVIHDIEKLPNQSDDNVLGKTHLVYLEDPEAAATVPMRSEDLPPSDFIGEEEEIPTDAVEDTLSDASVMTPPSTEELYEDTEQAPLDTEFSRGLTYDEISNAVGVLKTVTTNVDKTLAAARTIFNLKHTDLFEFFTTQISNTAAVERLLVECLDDGEACHSFLSTQSKSNDVTTFRWERYI